MDRKLIDYLPPVLQRVMEFIAITDAQQPEIEKAWAALELVMDNQFIGTATEVGVSIWESELGIVSVASDTLADRKMRILSRYMQNTPCTRNGLETLLQTLCGADGYTLTMHSPFELTVQVALAVKKQVEIVRETLGRVLPSNIAFTVTPMYETRGHISVGACAGTNSFVEIYPE